MPVDALLNYVEPAINKRTCKVCRQKIYNGVYHLRIYTSHRYGNTYINICGNCCKKVGKMKRTKAQRMPRRTQEQIHAERGDVGTPVSW